MIYRGCSEEHRCVDHEYLNSDVLLRGVDVIYYFYVAYFNTGLCIYEDSFTVSPELNQPALFCLSYRHGKIIIPSTDSLALMDPACYSWGFQSGSWLLIGAGRIEGRENWFALETLSAQWKLDERHILRNLY